MRIKNYVKADGTFTSKGVAIITALSFAAAIIIGVINKVAEKASK